MCEHGRYAGYAGSKRSERGGERKEKSGFFQRLFRGLTKTRDNIVKNMDYVFRRVYNIDEDFYEELEETLIMGDLGVAATERILDDLREKVKQQHIKDPWNAVSC